MGYYPPLMCTKYVPILAPNLGFESTYNFRFICKGSHFYLGLLINPINFSGTSINGGRFVFSPNRGVLEIKLEDGTIGLGSQETVYTQNGLSGFSLAQMNTFDITLYVSYGLITTVRFALSVNKTLIDLSPRLAYSWLTDVVVVPFFLADDDEPEVYIEQVSVSR